jgi:hypothetical protein
MTQRAGEFLEIYRVGRIDDRQLLLLSSILFGVAALCGLLAGLQISGKLGFAIAAAVIPPLTTALAAYEGLYAFERNAKLYRDAARNLSLVRAPSAATVTGESLAEFVAGIEAIFAREQGQWGQLAAKVPTGEQKESA